MICSKAMLIVLGNGNKFWKTCCKAVNTNIVPMHGLKGKISNNIMDLSSGSLKTKQELAEPGFASTLINADTPNKDNEDIKVEEEESIFKMQKCILTEAMDVLPMKKYFEFVFLASCETLEGL
jgi:hypothetical protein